MFFSAYKFILKTKNDDEEIDLVQELKKLNLNNHDVVLKLGDNTVYTADDLFNLIDSMYEEKGE